MTKEWACLVCGTTFGQLHYRMRPTGKHKQGLFPSCRMCKIAAGEGADVFPPYPPSDTTSAPQPQPRRVRKTPARTLESATRRVT